MFVYYNMNSSNYYYVFTQTGTITPTGTNPDVQLRLMNTSSSSAYGQLYASERLQDLNSFILSFEVGTDSASGDGFSVHFGGTSNPVNHYSAFSVGGFCIQFQIFNAGGSLTPGIHLWDNTGTRIVTTTNTGFINTPGWKNVHIMYNKRSTNTWTVMFDNIIVYTYSNTNNDTWLTSSGSSWGFTTYQAGARANMYIRRVNLNTTELSGTGLPTGGEMSLSLIRDNLYNFDKECFVDKLSTSSQNGCSAAYSTRLLRSNYYGPMVRVRRGSDNTEQDFYGDVFGKLGTRIYANGMSLTTWLGGATGYVRTIYDQSGNVRNVEQTTNANQPIITSNLFFDDFNTDTSANYTVNTFFVNSGTSGFVWDTTNSLLKTNTSNNEMGIRVNSNLLPQNINSIDITVEFAGSLDNDGSGVMIYDEINNRVWMATITNDFPNPGNPNGTTWSSGLTQTGRGIAYTNGLDNPNYLYVAVGNVINVSVPHTLRFIYQGGVLSFFVDGILHTSFTPPSPIFVKTFGIISLANNPAASFSSLRASFDGETCIRYNGSQWLQVTNTQIPSIPMTSNSSGGLVATASSYDSVPDSGRTWDVFNLFDLNGGTGWASTINTYSNGRYIGTVSTTDVNSGVHRGEWVQLQLASPVKLNSFYITPRPTSMDRVPRDFVILGSNDGLNWNIAHQEFNINNWTVSPKMFTVLNANTSYSYYRMVIKSIGNYGMNGNMANFMEWILNPTTVPLAAGNDTYTYYATWTPSANGIMSVCEQNTLSPSNGRRAALLCFGLNYGFNGEYNDRHNLVPFNLNIKRRTVMMCNHTLTSENIEIYDEGVLYKGTTDAPANLNIGGDIFVIGRKINGSEYFLGDMNEIIITNTTSIEREALLYFTPSLLTKPRELFPKPKKMLTFYPSTDNSTPINHSVIAVANLNLDLINVGNGNAVSDWNGYSQSTAGNRPVYYDRGGYTNDMGYVNFTRSSGQFLDGGSKTLNIATNGGFTSVVLLQCTGTPSYFERIYSFGQHLCCRNYTDSKIQFNLANNESYDFPVQLISPAGILVQNEWAVFSFRYRASDNFCEMWKNGLLVASGTGGTINNRTVTYSRVGCENTSGSELFNGNIGGLYIFDRYLSDNAISALSNSLSIYALPNIPRHISDINNVYSSTISPVFVPTVTDWSAYFDGNANKYIDIQDIPGPPLSYSFWFNASSIHNGEIIGLGDQTRTSGGIAFELYDNGYIYMYMYDGVNWPMITGGTISYAANTWYNVVITLDTNYQIQLFINGIFQLKYLGTSLPYRRTRLILGAPGHAWDKGFKGFISDVRVYDYILRSDEVLMIYNKVSMNQVSLQSSSSYLVNCRNWYSIMQNGHNGVGAFTITSSGNDPNIQYRLLNATQSVNNYIYHLQRVQDYRSFTCSFEIYTSTLDGAYGGGDQMYFFVGATSLPVQENNYNNCNYLDFQVWNGSGNAKQGVAFFRNGVNVSQSHYSRYKGAGRWISVSITYNRNQNEASWIVNMDGHELINYTDTNNESWRTSSGNYWGIGAWSGGATMDAYIRRVELTYVPIGSTSLIKGLNQNTLKRYPEQALTSNSSFNCVASASSAIVSGEDAWNAFDFTTNNTIWTVSTVDYYSSGTYVRSPATSTTIDNVSYTGEWLQIQLPIAIILQKYTLLGRFDDLIRSPKLFYIAGSNDGSTWTMVDTRSDITGWITNLPFEFIPSKRINAYAYYRIVVNQNNGGRWMSIQQWELYSLPFNGVKHPIGPMTSNTTTLGGIGTYVASASTESDVSVRAWNAFDNNSSTLWHSNFPIYNANGNYTGSITTTANTGTYSGEWLQIQLPNQIRLSSFLIHPRTIDTLYLQRSPRSFVILGSNDGSSWIFLYEQTNVNDWSNIAKTFETNINELYSYFRMVIRRIGNYDNDGSQNSVQIGEWTLYDKLTITNIYRNVVPGLVEGLTWKYYHNYLVDNMTAFDNNAYRNIGRTTNLSNLYTATNGQYYDNWADTYSIEWTGYFRANVTGIYTFDVYTDDACYVWIGSTALSGYTTSNYLLYENSGHPATRINTIYLIEGIYYPFRMRWGEFGGLDYMYLSFTPPNGTATSDGTGYFFSSIGTNQAYPAESAKVIKDISQTNSDGVYYINVNGVSTATYCLMNDIYDGGGWMMLMKASTGTTFQYTSNYWTTTNTLNPSDTNRNNGDAKFDVFNYLPIKDVMAIWPDIPSSSYTNIYGKNGGSLNIQDGWVWKIDNWYDATFPPYGITANGQTLNDITYTASSGTLYDVNSRQHWRAFNYLTTEAEEWHSGSGYNTSTGLYSGGITTNVNGVSVGGDYLQLQMSSSQYINRFGMIPRPEYNTRIPKNFIFAGSNDGSTWTNLYETTDSGSWANNWKYFDLTNPGTYSYYRIVVRGIFPDPSSDSVQIAELRLFGNGATTALNGFQRTRDAPSWDPYTFNGFGSNLFSSQNGYRRHVFGNGNHVTGVNNQPIRWGLIFNNENDFNSVDAYSGIGISGYSSGDVGANVVYINSRLNRTARVELYGR